MSEARAVLSIDDLSDDEIRRILSTAGEYLPEGKRKLNKRRFSIALLFLTPSTRTRAGFAEAALRLGGAPVDVSALRWDSGMSTPESLEDTLRIITGMFDVTVVRVPVSLDRETIPHHIAGVLVNGGDSSPGEHPSQALIDLFAIRSLRGLERDLRIGICGDLMARSCRSLLRLFDRFPPAALTLFSPPELRDGEPALGPSLAAVTSEREEADFSDVDVLCMVGFPATPRSTSLGFDMRNRYSLTHSRLSRMRDDAIVLSPMPVIDEISADARVDPRVRMFEQSDMAVSVRMAILDVIGELR